MLYRLIDYMAWWVSAPVDMAQDCTFSYFIKLHAFCTHEILLGCPPRGGDACTSLIKEVQRHIGSVGAHLEYCIV